MLGFFYVHTYPFDVSLAPDPSTPPPIHTEYGDTDYYFFETEDLPLFGPLRTLGVPEPLIDVVEPFFKVIVELGYDRSIKPWEPTPARLIPPLNPVTVAGDLVDAIGEGVTNAATLIGAPKPPAVTHDDLTAPQRTVGREVATTTRDRLNAAIGTVKSVIGDGRTIVRSAAVTTARKYGHRQPCAEDAGAAMRSRTPAVTSRRSSPKFPTASRRHLAPAKTKILRMGVRTHQGDLVSPSVIAPAQAMCPS